MPRARPTCLPPSVCPLPEGPGKRGQYYATSQSWQLRRATRIQENWWGEKGKGKEKGKEKGKGKGKKGEKGAER